MKALAAHHLKMGALDGIVSFCRDEFGRRVQDAVLFGFTVLTQEDACHAATRLVERAAREAAAGTSGSCHTPQPLIRTAPGLGSEIDQGLRLRGRCLENRRLL